MITNKQAIHGNSHLLINTYPLLLLTGDAVPPEPPFSPGVTPADAPEVTSVKKRDILQIYYVKDPPKMYSWRQSNNYTIKSEILSPAITRYINWKQSSANVLMTTTLNDKHRYFFKVALL